MDDKEYSISKNMLDKVLIKEIKKLKTEISRLRAETGNFPRVFIKSTTGDPTTGNEGVICINTADNNAKMYADGGWRTLASGW